MRPSEALRLLAVVLFLGVLAAYSFSLAWRLPRNTLEHIPGWVSTKTTLSRGVMGAFSFVTEPQALADGALDLSAWHGFHELRLERPVPVEELELSFDLAPGAWFSLILARPDGESSGLRFSRGRAPVASRFRLTAAGRIESSAPLPLLEARALGSGWHRLRLVRESAALRVLLDGEQLDPAFADVDTAVEIRFRGGLRPARVDWVRLRAASGEEISEDFDHRFDVGKPILAAGLCILLLDGLFYFAQSFRSPNVKGAVFGIIVLNGVLLFVGTSLAGYMNYRGGSYTPDHTLLARENYWRGVEASSIVKQIRERMERSPADERRVLFLGSSQTWGAGAEHPSDVWVQRVEELLKERGVYVACINAGISSANSGLLLELYRHEWAALSPATVVINFGTNDRDAEELARNVDHMLRIARASGSSAVIVLEPNSPEADRRGLSRRHTALRRVAGEHGVPVVDMQAYLDARQDEGFLWWDTAHLSSYGQELFADRIADVLLSRFLKGENRMSRGRGDS